MRRGKLKSSAAFLSTFSPCFLWRFVFVSLAFNSHFLIISLVFWIEEVWATTCNLSFLISHQFFVLLIESLANVSSSFLLFHIFFALSTCVIEIVFPVECMHFFRTEADMDPEKRRFQRSYITIQAGLSACLLFYSFDPMRCLFMPQWLCLALLDLIVNLLVCMYKFSVRERSWIPSSPSLSTCDFFSFTFFCVFFSVPGLLNFPFLQQFRTVTKISAAISYHLILVTDLVLWIVVREVVRVALYLFWVFSLSVSPAVLWYGFVLLRQAKLLKDTQRHRRSASAIALSTPRCITLDCTLWVVSLFAMHIVISVW